MNEVPFKVGQKYGSRTTSTDIEPGASTSEEPQPFEEPTTAATGGLIDFGDEACGPSEARGDGFDVNDEDASEPLIAVENSLVDATSDEMNLIDIG